MARIPVRFQRVAAAFDADVARVRLCESSGSEHSPESLTDLSDLVKSFMEKNETTGEKEELAGVIHFEEDRGEEQLEETECSHSEKMEMLRSLFSGNEEDDEDERDAKERIRREVEVACGVVGNNSKRHLMSRLREKGFDAGLCKSKWEKNGRLTAGNYEYIDVNLKGKRYVVEICLGLEFEIARPTDQYSALLDVFPLIFVGKVDELKQVVRLMCTAIKDSMKRMKLHIPPWRRNVYMQAKWFSAYKRTTNAVATKRASPPLSSESLFLNRSIGFEVLPLKTLNCRDGDYATNAGFRISHLTAVFNSDNLGL
ncbi:uncharacterized protein LOC124832985 [Vigna umbellata]|uniref:uncharacterized protein LOC124832985 n=1 Tax=Vigna umbellata TaxID=87088 RepID=UPI001F5F2253|nr:uncharacterized protein LOC124832985 [Vigna umbellata]